MILVSVVPGRDDVVEGGGVGDVFVGANVKEGALEGPSRSDRFQQGRFC